MCCCMGLSSSFTVSIGKFCLFLFFVVVPVSQTNTVKRPLCFASNVLVLGMCMVGWASVIPTGKSTSSKKRKQNLQSYTDRQMDRQTDVLQVDVAQSKLGLHNKQPPNLSHHQREQSKNFPSNAHLSKEVISFLPPCTDSTYRWHYQPILL